MFVGRVINISRLGELPHQGPRTKVLDPDAFPSSRLLALAPHPRLLERKSLGPGRSCDGLASGHSSVVTLFGVSTVLLSVLRYPGQTMVFIVRTVLEHSLFVAALQNIRR